MSNPKFILLLSCHNTAGIVKEVSSYLFDQGCNIVDAQQFDDLDTNQFFMRVLFDAIDSSNQPQLERLKVDFEPVAEKYGMQWSLRLQSQRKRVMLMVSGYDHCLRDLLYRSRNGELPMEISAVVANHPQERYSTVDLQGIAFHYLPVTADTKREQEAKLLALVESTQTDLVVLARYMQILSNELSRSLEGRCINIHHSFLPGFKGARPYHQAHERGVKLIGATSHFVTSDLDEGPIIEQDVERISHRDNAEDLVRKGRDIERRVLARAVRAYLEDRVIPNGRKTIVFEG
ncbi:formyltetrahydrofolate deformylase [Pseudomonas aeruginosa]|uniref:formyltetrahydrofolate deformylase n=1 Tax=Pseudomonas aeruginosa TaxID=287 RepID=UPI0007A9A8F0|nr:formyltetrahydrofolate deformylase [Pseudomonas aeruginosa]SAJ30145.1 formyltetrahydrofolate deformylase [Enterobacter cloacae]ELK4788218.1 formyltetrahydrofolate deformylase [Pseudomonas aeruginosa]MBG6790985.1 formyltetrahydrofolate deformylase [Pseudomonas aeruginosa]MBG6799184.1 formyltetrahydrofolate deformylase [Pseudomonas aeruginosa]MEA8709983.1 formyltetrahydrofolate deformylase [Pseudomonas aeruginosa]